MRVSSGVLVALLALVALVGAASAAVPAAAPVPVRGPSGEGAGNEEEATMRQGSSGDQFLVHVARVMEAMDQKIAVLEGLRRETEMLIEMLSSSAPAMMPVTAGIAVGFAPRAGEAIPPDLVAGVPDEGTQCVDR